MRLLTILLMLCVLAGCQTAKVNDTAYLVSGSTAELGSIGVATGRMGLSNAFSTRAFPILQSGVRLDVKPAASDKKMHELYLKKAGLSPIAVHNSDSIAEKQQFFTVSVLDKAGYVNEINNPQNSEVVKLVSHIKEVSIVTGLALVFSPDNTALLKEADAFYLVSVQGKKYGMALFKEGKKIGLIDLSREIVLGYTLDKFCWALSDRNQWYIADMIGQDDKCLGNTEKKIREKEETNLFKM